MFSQLSAWASAPKHVFANMENMEFDLGLTLIPLPFPPRAATTVQINRGAQVNTA